MSLINNIIKKVMLNNKKDYDPNNPPDYVMLRENSLKQNQMIPLPKGVKYDNTNFDDVDVGIAYKNDNKDKVILYLHGGGFLTGSFESRCAFVAHLAKQTDICVYTPNYRLAPEYIYPSAIDDCYKSYLALLDQFKPKNIFVIGESAGGNLVLSLIHMLKDNDKPMPCGIAVMSPTVQFLDKYDSYTANYAKDPMLCNIHEEILDTYFKGVKEQDVAHKYASPINGDFDGFPKTLITVSDEELLKEDSYKLYEKMQSQGVDVNLISRKNYIHAWPIIISIPESKRDLKIISKYIVECFA